MSGWRRTWNASSVPHRRHKGRRRMGLTCVRSQHRMDRLVGARSRALAGRQKMKGPRESAGSFCAVTAGCRRISRRLEIAPKWWANPGPGPRCVGPEVAEFSAEVASERHREPFANWRFLRWSWTDARKPWRFGDRGGSEPTQFRRKRFDADVDATPRVRWRKTCLSSVISKGGAAGNPGYICTDVPFPLGGWHQWDSCSRRAVMSWCVEESEMQRCILVSHNLPKSPTAIRSWVSRLAIYPRGPFELRRLGSTNGNRSEITQPLSTD
jgi:hypothetical protein